MEYYIVAKQTAEANQGAQNGSYQLYFRKKKDGQYVVNVGCGEELFSSISWNDFPKVELTADDFPTDNLIKK